VALSDIQHIVVLVMENRSFDHLLGYKFGDATKRTNTRHLPHGGTATFSAMKLTTPRFTPGPDHKYNHVAKQLSGKDGEPMSGFIDDYASVDGVKFPEFVMGYYDRETVKTYEYFANNFLVVDDWFCSVPGPTLPNRCFLLAGHSAGIVKNVHLGLHLLTRGEKTVFDLLSEGGVSWRSYYHDVPFLWLFKRHTLSKENTFKIEQFYADAAAGTLPSVSWIDPNFTLQSAIHLPNGARFPDAACDDHPPADITRGQELARDVFKALRASSAWERTLFILTYDEHGGFYDSVSPPVREQLAPDNDEKFHRFGVRVPTFLISPWVEQGVLSSSRPEWLGPYEHTSILRTIVERFCPSANTQGLKERYAGARSVAHLLQATARDVGPMPDIEFPRPDNPPRLAVGGRFQEPTEIGDVDQPGEFHRLMAGLLDLAAKQA